MLYLIVYACGAFTCGRGEHVGPVSKSRQFPQQFVRVANQRHGVDEAALEPLGRDGPGLIGQITDRRRGG